MSEPHTSRREIREALTVLRDAGITAEQYATLDITEHWTLGGVEYPNRASAFMAAREQANQTGELAEVWLEWGELGGPADSWLVDPEATP